MVSAWLVMRHARPSAQVVGEVVLAALLLVVLAFAPRDAPPSAGSDNAVGSNVRFQVTPQERPSLGLTLPGLQNLVESAKAGGQAVSTKALIPTARPVQLLIPALNVHRAVEGVGVNRSRVMNLPINAWNAGWYKGGPVPGAPGDAVIEGHAGYPGQPMIFGRLSTLRAGDQIVVVLADTSRRLFVVVSMTTVPVGVAPKGMAEAGGPPRLTLITCTGSFDADNFSYSRRLVVEASYAGIV
jgi:hypothetical protein